jgi:hypothetical protein
MQILFLITVPLIPSLRFAAPVSNSIIYQNLFISSSTRSNTDCPDPDFGKCMQCAAIDPARYHVNPPLARSSIYTRCLQQYCFDPNNLTSASYPQESGRLDATVL